MSVRLVLIEESEALHGLAEAWQSLADRDGTAPFFRGPRWLLSWWRAYQRQLGAKLYTFAAFEGEELVGLAPFYQRQVRRSPARKVNEIRMLGDAGPRPPALDFLAAKGLEEEVGTALGEYLSQRSAEWDVIDLQPLRDPSPVRAHMANRLASSGRPMETSQAGGARRIELQAVGVDTGASESQKRVTIMGSDADSVRKGLAGLRRLSRLEWSCREEASPFIDRQATHLLEDVAPLMAKEGQARLARLDDSDGQAVASSLIIDDGKRAIVLALAVDPEREDAVTRLLAAEAASAAERGMTSMDISLACDDHELHMPETRQRAIHLCIYGTSSSASLARTYGKVRRRVEAARDVPGSAAAGARAAWARIRTAAANVANFERMHLYRGELWTRGLEAAPGLSMSMFSEEDFDAMSDSERELFLEVFERDEHEFRDFWQRGDIMVLAKLMERPAGIAWCALKPVIVPELDREIHLGLGEAYIHSLYVAPQARGRAVAPSMLEFLAHELRQKDVYKSWALIGSDNAASIRAFEKAAYAAVADVINAHLASVDKMMVRPPDPDAKKILGL